LWETGSRFGETFDGVWKIFRGSSIPENMGRIGYKQGKILGVRFWGSEFNASHILSSMGKMLEAENRKCRF